MGRAVGEQAAVMVGIGEIMVSKDPSSILVAYGLGSCGGVCLYDPAARVAGLAHVMLPSSAEAVGHTTASRFADRAVPMLLDEMARLGANRRRIVAKMAGGAKMLTGSAFANGFNIGERNVDAVKALLQHLGVSLRAAAVGGSQGRTVTMHVGSGAVLVRTAGEREAEL